MGCGEFVVKYILFFTNLVFALGGLALLGLGIAAELRIAAVTDFLVEQNLALPAISSMVVGSIVFLIAFFGCCGAIRESNCMLVTYSIVMLFLMVAKIALAVLVFVKLDDVVADVPKWVGEAFTRSPTQFQDLERTLHCCGVNGASSYLPSRLVVPDSCCDTAPCTVLNSYDGCSQVISTALNTFGLAIGIIAIVIAAMELVAVVFGLCLANHVKNKQRRQYY